MTHPTPEDLISPICRPTVDRLQLVLDGELEANAIENDPHPAVCVACRERVATAKLMLSVLASPEAVVVPSGMADRIVTAVREDRYSRIRRRSYAASLGVLATLAAALMLGAWITPKQPIVHHPEDWIVKPQPEVAPAPREVAQAKPLRIGDELTKAGIALREAPKAITEPASAAPELFTKLSNAITRPIEPMPEELEPARSTLSELPDVALTGLEPLTDTAQKAFSRLMRDVGTVNVKPKS
ncbi:MAG: hypothetical protein K8U57_35160 [Planctomycetes bacterium]|nr:hypothetical protein [Planctomycetota bacterium]